VIASQGTTGAGLLFPNPESINCRDLVLSGGRGFFEWSIQMLMDARGTLSRRGLLCGAVLSVGAGMLHAADEQKPAADGWQDLFDGKSLRGWDGDGAWFRVEDGAIVGGRLTAGIPHNFFLSSQQEYGDFELKLEFRLLGEGTNAGIQLRSRRIPKHHEMIGYQADLGQNYWGALYDESRRNRILAAPDKAELAKVLRLQDWNRYRIHCEGRRIQLWINDYQTVNYLEEDPAIEQRGLLALQIHGGGPGEAHYRGLRIRRLNGV